MATTTKRILLVEDEPLIAAVEQQMLRSCSFDVVHAADGKQAIDCCDNIGDIDLVLMDIDLGSGMDGMEAARLILQKHDLPITFLSSHDDKDIIERTNEVTIYGYIVKPPSSVALRTSIVMALRLFEANRKLSESEQKFKCAFEISHNPMSINDFNDDSRFVDCNEAFLKLLGYTKDEVIGLTPADINLYVHPSERATIRSLIATEGKVVDYPHTFRTKNGMLLKGKLNVDKFKAQGRDLIFVTVDHERYSPPMEIC
jgi:PAS domain S-box-containing protein